MDYLLILHGSRPGSEDAFPPQAKVSEVRHALMLCMTVCLDAVTQVGRFPSPTVRPLLVCSGFVHPPCACTCLGLPWTEAGNVVLSRLLVYLVFTTRTFVVLVNCIFGHNRFAVYTPFGFIS